MSLGKLLRALWNAVSWATVLNLPRIKLNSQLSHCAFFSVCPSVCYWNPFISSSLSLWFGKYIPSSDVWILLSAFSCPRRKGVNGWFFGSLWLSIIPPAKPQLFHLLLIVWVRAAHGQAEMALMSPGQVGLFHPQVALTQDSSTQGPGATWWGCVYRNLPPSWLASSFLLKQNLSGSLPSCRVSGLLLWEHSATNRTKANAAFTDAKARH